LNFESLGSFLLEKLCFNWKTKFLSENDCPVQALSSDVRANTYFQKGRNVACRWKKVSDLRCLWESTCSGLQYLIFCPFHLCCVTRLQQPKHRTNPCSEKLMKLINALEASQGKINGPVYKYVKDVEECYRLAGIEKQKSGQAGTLYYLSQYLDLNKFKQK